MNRLSNRENISHKLVRSNTSATGNTNSSSVSSGNPSSSQVRQKIVYQDKEIEQDLGLDYFTIRDGESYDLQFFEHEDAEAKGKLVRKVTVKGYGGGQPTVKFQFIVGVLEEEGDVRYRLNLVKTHANVIYIQLRYGHRLLRISRKGSGMKDTEYFANPLDDPSGEGDGAEFAK